jgi:poly-beta-hydroxyalkanoate depolymerase
MATAISLDRLVARAKAHKMTPSEKRNQRVSMIMGLKGHKSTLTREQVEELMEEHEGHETGPSPENSQK